MNSPEKEYYDFDLNECDNNGNCINVESGLSHGEVRQAILDRYRNDISNNSVLAYNNMSATLKAMSIRLKEISKIDPETVNELTSFEQIDPNISIDSNAKELMLETYNMKMLQNLETIIYDYLNDQQLIDCVWHFMFSYSLKIVGNE